MPITEFRVQNEKAVKLAECKKIPSLMIIAGPNGVGKSTLLYALKQRKGIQGTAKIVYLPPHRSWRRQTIRRMFLWGRTIRYGDLLAGDNIGGIEGLRMFGEPRRPDSLDEAQAAIKYVLGQLETRRQHAITKTFDDKGIIEKSAVPDIYEPLRTLLGFLLPHLEFVKIDLASEENIRCVFRHRYHANLELDIDDLSSGEKEVFSLFLPFLEARIGKTLATLEGQADVKEEDWLVIIDEPEQHLHPSLQERLLDYMREIVRTNTIQFILATHSPSLINGASLDELYVLSMPEPMDDYNQLQQVITRPERVEAIRSISGEISYLTAGRPLVFLEGVAPPGEEPSDKRLLEILDPAFSKYVLIPFKNRERVKEVVKQLSSEPELTFEGLQVFAILDRDRETGSVIESERIFLWPMCSIENFLLTPSAIWEVVNPHREKTSWKSVDDVSRVLADICKAQAIDEVRLRNNKGQNKAEEEIKEIQSNKKELQLFSGKMILRKLYNEIGSQIGMSYRSFCYDIARNISSKGPPSELVFIRRLLDNYVPISLEQNLSDILVDIQKRGSKLEIEKDLQEIISLTHSAVANLETGSVVTVDRRELKKKLWTTLQQVRQSYTDLSPKIESALAKTVSIGM